MKISIRLLAIFLLLLGGALQVGAQLFPQPQPYMYDRGYEAYSPMQGVRRMVFSRYIPGARFPNDWDVIVESYAYDPQGNLVRWNRYQNVTGEASLQTNYTWSTDGKLLSEHIILASDHSEIYRNYTWEKDAAGKYLRARIDDKAKKPISLLELQPDGGYLQTEYSLGNGKVLNSAYNAKKQLLRTENTATGLVEEYTYDDKGLLAAVNIKNANGTTTKIQYTNKYDDQGHLVSQTESGRGTPKTIYFKYDAAGNMVERGMIANQPTELRGYDPMNRLTSILFLDAQGFPKEVLNISYETYYP